MAAEVEFLVKNPGRPAQEDIRIRVPASASVRELKAALQAGSPGSPHPTTITVRAAGCREEKEGVVAGTECLAGATHPRSRLPARPPTPSGRPRRALRFFPRPGRPFTLAACSRTTMQ